MDALLAWHSVDVPQIYSYVHFDRFVFDQVIDTPPFQRLRFLSQLGVCKLVYPSATHTRFEHSMGVGDLARRYFGLLAGRLSGEAFAEESGFPDGSLPLGVGAACQEVRRLAQCVELAGLCHDLGHGPFSHAFEEDFINVLRSKGTLSAVSLIAPATNAQPPWRHEDMSQKIAAELLSPLIDRGGPSELEPDDLEIIKTMIEGVPPGWSGVSGLDFVDSLTRAAFDIVSNKRTGLDVDRFDYLSRDAAFLPSTNALPSISPSRILMHSRVINGHICYNAKELHSIYQIFHARYSMFNLVYLHRKVRAMELMISEALREADSVFKWSEMANEVEDFLTLTDESILNDVLFHPLFAKRRALAAAKLDAEDVEALEKAHHLLHRVTRGRRGSDLFRFVSAVDFTGAQDLSALKEAATPEIISRFADGVSSADLVVDWQHLHYGMGDKSPFEYVRLFSNSDPSTCFLASEEMLSAYPKEYSHRQLRLYCRDNTKAEAAATAFKSWAAHHSFEVMCEGKPAVARTLRAQTPLRNFKRRCASLEEWNSAATSNATISQSPNSGLPRLQVAMALTNRRVQQESQSSAKTNAALFEADDGILLSGERTPQATTKKHRISFVDSP